MLAGYPTSPDEVGHARAVTCLAFCPGVLVIELQNGSASNLAAF